MVSNAITVNIIEDKEMLDAAFNLRRDIFITEQKLTEEEEFDGLDDECTHYIAKVAGSIAGTVRLRTLQTEDDGDIKIERFSVAKNYRGHGVGREIMKKILKDIQNKNLKTALLYGQSHAVGFYQSFGFKPYGDEFMDARIPHRKLKLQF